ncbi:MAG: hypothetical protein AB1508_16775 [Pseudomonadota bacterium]
MESLYELISKYGEIGSALFAFVAAILWVLSATVKIPKTFSINVLTEHTEDAEFPGSQIIASGWGESAELTELGMKLGEQSRLSAFAAIAAAGAAILQVAVILVRHTPN